MLHDINLADESSSDDIYQYLKKKPKNNKKPKQKLNLSEYNLFVQQRYLESGWKHLNEERYDSAIMDFNALIEIIPQCDRAYSGRASAYYKQRKYTLAINDINIAININPGYATDFLIRARAYFVLKNYDAALLDCNFVIELNPNDAIAYKILADIYHQQKEYESAILTYNQAQALNSSQHYDFFSQRGEAHAHQGNMNNAMTDYKQALTLNPECASTINKLNTILLNINNSNILHEIEKENLFDVINLLPETDQLHWLNKCRDRNTALGRIMYKPRNAFAHVIRFFKGNPEDYDFIKCDLSKGMLKKISQQIETINRNRGIELDVLTQELPSFKYQNI